jgi:hypothetical protein
MSSNHKQISMRSGDMPYKMSKRDRKLSRGSSTTRNGKGTPGPNRPRSSPYGESLDDRLARLKREVTYLEVQVEKRNLRKTSAKGEVIQQPKIEKAPVQHPEKERFQTKPIPKFKPKEDWQVVKGRRSSVGERKQKSVGMCEGSMTHSSSMGALPCNTSPLRPASPSKQLMKLAPIGEEPNGVASVPQKPGVTQAKSTAATSAANVRPSKSRHGYQLDQTKLMKKVTIEAEGAIDDAADKPVFRETRTSISKTKVKTWREKQVERKRKTFVAEDLYWYMRMEFLFEVRNKDALRRMKMKAKQFMSNHDMNGLTLEAQYVLVIETIRAVMEISPEEEGLRQGLRSEDGVELRRKHAALHEKGQVGRSWFGSTKMLPGTKPQ